MESYKHIERNRNIDVGLTTISRAQPSLVIDFDGVHITALEGRPSSKDLAAITNHHIISKIGFIESYESGLALAPIYSEGSLDNESLKSFKPKN